MGIPGVVDGEKVKMPEVLNREIVIIRTERRTSNHADPDGSYPPYVIIQFYFANDAEKRHRVVFTASKNIIGQLDSPNMTYPCLATIKMMGKSFCLT